MSKAVKTISLIILLFLIILLVIANIFLRDIYLFFAPMPENTGELSATPVLVDEELNLYKVDIKFKSGEDVDIAKPVSAVAFSLSYPKDPNVRVVVVDEQGNETDKVTLGPIVSSEQWRVPINTIRDTQEGVSIEFAAVNVTPSGFTTSNYVTLGTVYFRSQQPINQDTFVLTFNTDKSAIISKDKPTADILDTDAKLYYSID